MKAMESNTFVEKEKLNMHLESVKYKDLEFLKTKGGPFTTSEEVEKFMANNEIETKEKNQRLYVEVRYTKNSSLRLKHSDSVFRLKRTIRTCQIKSMLRI